MLIFRRFKSMTSRRWQNSSTDTRETYTSWYDMCARCLNPNHIQFADYGGRGITVCDRWVGNYDAFYQDMGPRPAGMTIERIDNNQGYDPFNCRWATQAEQKRNTRRSRMITIEGRTQALEDWASEIGIDPRTMNYRLRRRFPTEKLLAPPSKKHQTRRAA